MSYSYFNESGKLVSGAAANSHKMYTIFGSPAQYWLFAAMYTITGLVLANKIRKSIHKVGDALLNNDT